MIVRVPYVFTITSRSFTCVMMQAVKAMIVLSSLRQVTLHGVRSKTKNLHKQVFLKQSEMEEYKVDTAEMQTMMLAITQTATEATRVADKAISEVADPVEVSAKTNATGNGGPKAKQADNS